MALTISATFWLGTPDWELNISPTVMVETQMLPKNMAITLPHAVLVRHDGYMRGWTQYVDDIPDAAWLHSHELTHVRQWEHLGPAFPIAYAATLGRPFEDYKQPNPWVGTQLNCPLIRITNQTASLLPCYTKGS